MKTIVIVGGGAGGLELATRLGDRLGKRKRAKIVLIDSAPTHFWKPLLHAVAAGKVDPHLHQVEYSAHAADHHFEFAGGEVTSVDRINRTVAVIGHYQEGGFEVLPRRLIQYDKLVLAFGAVTNFFGVPGAAANSLTLDSVRQAELFRRRFIASCVQASNQKSTGTTSRAGVHVVIVGGGATGVELAAELSHTVRALAKYNIHSLNPDREVNVSIIERGDRLLPQLNPELSQAAARQLGELGVNVCTGTAVSRVDTDAVHDSSGRKYSSNITVWAAGVEGSDLCRETGLPLNKARQILVLPSLQTVGDPDVFAIGDCSSYVCPFKGTALPPRAQVAHQQALFLADTLMSPELDRPPRFHFRDYGSLVSLGPFAAVGVLFGIAPRRGVLVRGAAARLLYSLMYRKHVLSLHGFVRMAAQTLAHWIRKKITPPIRLH